MPKLKTKSSAKKRFTLTGKNKIKRAKANHSHQLGNKNTKHKRRLRATALVDESNFGHIRRLINT